MKRGRVMRVIAPHFEGALILGDDGVCSHAAPILAQCIGRPGAELRRMFAANGWRVKPSSLGNELGLPALPQRIEGRGLPPLPTIDRKSVV